MSVFPHLQSANVNKDLKNREQVLDADEFVTFYMNLMSRSEVKELFTRYTERGCLLLEKHLSCGSAFLKTS
jgi:hypothetical protein